MDRQFTEQDSIHIAEAAKNNIIGEISREPYADCLTVCPILTAGALANPKYERGGVACLRDACAFYDIENPNPDSRECCAMLAGSRASLIAEYMEALCKLIDRRL